MKFDYTATLDDFKTFQIYNFFQKNEKRLLLRFKVVLVAGLIISMGIISALTKDYRNLYITIFVCSFLPFIIPKKLILGMYRARIENRINKDDYPEYPCSCSIELNNKNVSITTANSKSEIDWNGITDIHITENHFYLYSSPTTAIIIPKNGISTNNPDEVEKELLKIEKALTENVLRVVNKGE